MQVICISPIITADAGYENHPRPEVGDRDYVTDIQPHPDGGSKKYYSLERFGNMVGFKTDHFAILPDQSAEIMEEQSVNLQPA